MNSILRYHLYCKHCGHGGYLHRHTADEVANYQSLGLTSVNASCRGQFVRRRGKKREPFDSGYGCTCPGYEPEMLPGDFTPLESVYGHD